MKAKERILAKHPRAIAHLVPEDGSDRWEIWPSKQELGQRLLGSGATEEEAWQDAANRL
jgi:hypothetical protein